MNDDELRRLATALARASRLSVCERLDAYLSDPRWDKSWVLSADRGTHHGPLYTVIETVDDGHAVLFIQTIATGATVLAAIENAFATVEEEGGDGANVGD